MINNNPLTKRNLRIMSTYLKEYLNELGYGTLNPNSYHCIRHEDKHPSMYYFIGDDGKPRVKCFSCNTVMDVYNVVQHNNSSLSFKEQYLFLCKHFNQNPYNPEVSSSYRKSQGALLSTFTAEQKAKINQYINNCLTNTKDRYTAWQARGISSQFVDQLRLGYDQQLQALVIPVPDGYIQRFINAKGSAPKYKKSFGFRHHFQSDCENKNFPIIITEGEIDAISILMLGYPNVLALSGASNLITKYDQEIIAKSFKAILAMDRDGQGIKSTQALLEHCEKLNWPFPNIFWDLFNPNDITNIKDPNELLLSNARLLKETINSLIKQWEGDSYERAQ